MSYTTVSQRNWQEGYSQGFKDGVLAATEVLKAMGMLHQEGEENKESE